MADRARVRSEVEAECHWVHYWEGSGKEGAIVGNDAKRKKDRETTRQRQRGGN
jgi:hypothetical protein